MFDYVTKFKFAKGLENHFSGEACQILFDYFEELEESSGKEIEYDPIAIRCEFAEYKGWREGIEDYSNYFEAEITRDNNGNFTSDVLPKNAEEAREFFEEYTQVLYCDNRFLVIQQF